MGSVIVIVFGYYYWRCYVVVVSNLTFKHSFGFEESRFQVYKIAFAPHFHVLCMHMDVCIYTCETGSIGYVVVIFGLISSLRFF